MDENPYESPEYRNAIGLEASMEEGEEILVQIAARSFSGRDRLFHLRSLVIGKLVVTNCRVFFLSSGKGEQIALYSEASMIERIGKSLDITALQRRGSWEFSIADIRFAEASMRPFWRGACLRLVGPDSHGTEVIQQVFRYGIERDTWEDVAAKINEIRQDHKREV
jgi:hypothetical protein